MKKYSVLIIFIVLMVLLSTMLFNRTYARYASGTDGNTNIGIAVPIYDETVKDITIPLNSMKPGSSYTYNFYIVNANTLGTVSDVTLDYYMMIESSTNLPITIILLNSNNTNILSNNITNTFTMPHSVLTTHNYSLKLDWNISYDDYQWENTVEALFIHIYIVQKAN